jgi:CDGSH-type Zn-finger protein
MNSKKEFEIKMSKGIIAQKSPLSAELEAGKSYFWCACGRSKSQPFCDGSHKGTGFSPVKYEAPKLEKVFFCCCKQTSNPPFCDGTHKTI